MYRSILKNFLVSFFHLFIFSLKNKENRFLEPFSPKNVLIAKKIDETQDMECEVIPK